MTTPAKLSVSISKFSPNELPHQLALKNEFALAYLYDNYSPALLGYIKRVVKSEVESEDILQAVILKVWNRASSYSDTKGGFFAWMMAIAKNESIDYLRSKRANNSRMTVRLSAGFSTHPSDYKPDTNRRDVHRALGCIPHKERIIVELYLRGFTCREIASICGLPEGTVKTRMRTSYRKMRLILS